MKNEQGLTMEQLKAAQAAGVPIEFNHRLEEWVRIERPEFTGLPEHYRIATNTPEEIEACEQAAKNAEYALEYWSPNLREWFITSDTVDWKEDSTGRFPLFHRIRAHVKSEPVAAEVKPDTPEADNLNDGGPAFPTENAHQSGSQRWHYEGMTLRDYFAGQALVGQLASCTPDTGINIWNLADWCYEMADAMLKAREVRK